MKLLEAKRLREAIEVDASKYVRAHGKKPKGGRGMWIFEANGIEMIPPVSMEFVDAVKWAKNEAKSMGATTLYVLG